MQNVIFMIHNVIEKSSALCDNTDNGNRFPAWGRISHETEYFSKKPRQSAPHCSRL